MKQKVEAIFDLRKAAEEHARAEVAVEQRDTPDRRDALLEARIALEDSTQEAIEACEHCGQAHANRNGCAEVRSIRR